MHTLEVTIQNQWQPLTLRQPPITESTSEADPWASYQDELDLQSPPSDTRVPQAAPVNDFTAAAARLLQRQKSMAEAAKKAQEEAKAKAAKSEK